MSDSTQGPGWWQASDGKWYPPELHPSVQQPQPPAPEAPVPDEPVTQPAASAQPPPPRRVTSDVEEDAALDLGSAVMPVLIQRYAGYAVAALVGVVIGWLLSRGNRRD